MCGHVMTYCVQGTPIVKLNGIKNRVKKWQCVSIPSLCPHGIYNDTEEQVIVLWCYVSGKDKVKSVQGIREFGGKCFIWPGES